MCILVRACVCVFGGEEGESEHSEEYSLIMAVWWGEGVTWLNISLPALWSAAIRGITDGIDLVFPWCCGTLHSELSNYLPCAHRNA